MERLATEEDSMYNYWGKADKENNYHLLVYHCLDVASVGKVWLEQSPSFVKRASKAAGLTDIAFCEWFTFFLAIHDLGKFDIRFQKKVPEVFKKLQPNTEFKSQGINNYNHGYAGFSWGVNECSDYFNTTSNAYYIWLQKVVGHHGKFPQVSKLDRPAFVNPKIIEQDKKSRIQFIQTMKTFFAPNQELKNLPEEPSEFLAGFCSICDWIGSNNEYFSFSSDFDKNKSDLENCQNYFNSRVEDALRALKEIGVIPSIQSEGGMKFLFSDYIPQGVQTVVNQLPLEQSLTIIEAPTGSGKTEAALSYASLLLSSGVSETVTFALPTQATTNAMLPRIEKVAPKMFKEEANLILAHGKSRFNEKYINIKNRNKNIPKNEDCKVQCSNWLGSSKKRSFLGQIGLSTIDQVLLSVLPVKHYFVRSFGIGRSILIIDEVHAYDNYMYGLLEEVIRQQKKLGGSIILLSATLPFIQKTKLLSAWDIEFDEDYDFKSASYPLITSSVLSEPLSLNKKDMPSPFSVSISLFYGKELQFSDDLISQIVNAGQNGASVCVICNIVADAQQFAKVISEKVSDNIPVDIFHSRYQFKDRKTKENAVIDQYGEEGKRMGRILVATQVVEQSLDIDFDWMVTQLCPADLLFQRLGRLHRHNHNRPKGFEERKVTVILPTKNLEFGGTGIVYSNVLALWKTQQLLEKNSVIEFPEAYRDWIEEVYDEDDSTVSDELKELNFDYICKNESRHYIANNLVQNRDTINAIDDLSDNASSLTRDGEMSVSLIPLSDDDTLLDGTIISNLAEWDKWEQLSLNTIPVPRSWRNNFTELEKGYMKIDMQKNQDYVFECDIGKYRFLYTSERGMERETI